MKQFIVALAMMVFLSATADAQQMANSMDHQLAAALDAPETLARLERKLQNDLGSAQTDQARMAIRLRLTLVSAFQSLPAGMSISDYRQVVLNTQILDQLHNLRSMKRNEASFDSDAVIESQEALTQMITRYWDQLKAYGSRQGAEGSRLCQLAANEVILAQFAGPLAGKLTIIELIGNESTKKYRWVEIPRQPLPSAAIASAGPIEFNLMRVHAPLVVIFKGENLIQVFQSEKNWLNALGLETPIVFLETVPDKFHALASLFISFPGRYVLSGKPEDPSFIWIVEPSSGTIVAQWPLDQLYDVKNSRIRSFINDLLTVAKQLPKAKSI